MSRPPIQRERSSVPTDQPEHRLSHWCEVLADRVILPIGPHFWTAQDTGTALFKTGSEEEKRRARFAWENHRRFVGIKPNQLDWRVFQAPIYAEIELKYQPTRERALAALSQGQKDTIAVLERQNVPWDIGWTVISFYEALKRIGFRLHGNAENIACEIETRWRAADETARATVKKTAKTYRPRSVKGTASHIRRVEAMRSRVLF